jgi:lipoprotein-releasing system permease protein
LYKLHLILKYLFRRRIAWVALLAVTLCTMMVLVVISVMGGWLDMFKKSFHGLNGDIVVRAESDSLVGFPYYKEMIDKIEAIHGVKSAVPVISTFGLFSVDNIVEGVQVTGYPITQIGKVNNFADSLYLQHQKVEDELKALPPTASGGQRDRLEKLLAEPPSFDLLDESSLFRPLPRDVKTDPKTGQIAGLPKDAEGLLRYDAVRGRLVFKGVMTDDQRSALAKLSTSPGWTPDIDRLYDLSHRPGVIAYRELLPMARNDPSNWSGMIVGAGVVGIHPDSSGEIVGRSRGMYKFPVTLSMLPIGGARVDVKDMVAAPFWIVDDSRTKVWQYDNRMVYVPFDVLQRDLRMDGGVETDDTTGQTFQIPPRTSEIDISALPGVDLDQLCQQVQRALEGVWTEKFGQIVSAPPPTAQTWLELQQTWIGAIEHEKVLTVFLFGIISIVAIFLIFCIFYMIAVEKTRDIGIIKSVGATSGGVAGIFLGYGATIGVIGGGMGLLLSYLIVHNINWLHMELGKHLGIVIWNPEVYMFDKIPNTMAWSNIVVIVGVAIVASILGALIPAMFAARLNPVQALRFE